VERLLAGGRARAAAADQAAAPEKNAFVSVK
jgi:hypothetical protein